MYGCEWALGAELAPKGLCQPHQALDHVLRFQAVLGSGRTGQQWVPDPHLAALEHPEQAHVHWATASLASAVAPKWMLQATVWRGPQSMSLPGCPASSLHHSEDFVREADNSFSASEPDFLHVVLGCHLLTEWDNWSFSLDSSSEIQSS